MSSSASGGEHSESFDGAVFFASPDESEWKHIGYMNKEDGWGPLGYKHDAILTEEEKQGALKAVEQLMKNLKCVAESSGYAQGGQVKSSYAQGKNPSEGPGGQASTRLLLDKFSFLDDWSDNCPDVDCKTYWKQGAAGFPPEAFPIPQLIVHLNDGHQWAREAIADWLDLFAEENGLDLSFPVPEEE